MNLIPNSWGSPRLRELNTCHGPGRGHPCVGAANRGMWAETHGSSIGLVGEGGKVHTAHYEREGTANEMLHTVVFPRQRWTSLSTHFRRVRDNVEWDDPPSIENFFRVQDYFAGKGLKVTQWCEFRRLRPSTLQEAGTPLTEVNRCHGKGRGHPCTGGAASLWASPDDVRKAVAAAATATVADVRAGKVPLIQLGDPTKVSASTVAQYQGGSGTVKVFDQFFSDDAFGRTVQLYHEFGHEVSQRAFAKDNAATVEVLRPFRTRPEDPWTYHNFAGLSSRPEEMLADVYAELMMSKARPWEEDGGKYAKVYEHVLTVAGKAGLPLPTWRRRRLTEVNRCHGPGRGHPCVGGPGEAVPSALAGSQISRFSARDVPTDAVERIFGRIRSMRQLAMRMVGDVTSTTFDVTCQYNQWWDAREKKHKEVIGLMFAGADGTDMMRSFTREDDGSLVAHHDVFEVGGESPAGLGKEVLRGTVRAYERIGVDRVETFADCDVGSYAWARFGFLPQDPAITAHRISMQINDLLKPGQEVFVNNRRDVVSHRVSAAEVDALRAMVVSTDPASIWRVAQTKAGDGFPLGKAVLMGMGWSAKLDLHNAAQMDVFHRYVGG